MRRRKKDENKWLSLEEALKELTLWSRIDLKLDQRETQRSHIPLLETIGRVLAEDIAAPFHIPPFHNSAMDGYALDFQVIDRSSGQAIPVSQRVPAGQKPEPHKPGTAARIFTGAMMPSGTDTVIPQEDVDEVEGGIIIREEVKKGQHVRRAGEEFAKHEVIMNKGTRISPQHIGLIAEMGLLHVAVTTPPKVALIATGDELVEPGRILPPAKIYDSNSYMLRSLLLANGVTDVHSVRIADDFEETKSTIEELSESVDLMISTGGVSVGDEDHISQYLSEHANLKFWKVAIKPGKPVAFAEINQTPFLGLPGNPVAAYVCFQWFVRPLVRSLLGQLMDPPLPMHMPLAMDVSAPSPRDRFLRAKPIEIEPGKVALSLFSSDSSSFLTSLCWGEGLGCVRKHTVPKAGDQIDYYPFSVF